MAVENETGLDNELDQTEELSQEELDTDDLEVVVDDSDEGDTEGADAEAAPAEEEPAPVEPDESVEEPAEEEPAEEADAELAALPEKIKKRFAREKRLRDTIIQERDQIKSAAVQVAQLAKQREDEILVLKKQNAAIQRQFAETLDYAYDKDIHAKAQELRRAREDGNYDAELKAQSELDKLRFEQNQVRQVKLSMPDPEKMPAPAPQAQPTPQQPAPQEQQKTPPSPLAVKWLQTNKAWFNSPKFRGHKAFVLAEDAALLAEGYDPKSKEYYAELDRRIDDNFPTLRKKSKPVSSPVAAVGRAPASNRSKTTVTLNKADLANMRRFGLDPSNKEQLREYALSKRA